MELHPLLKRQLKKHFGSLDKVPTELQSFINSVNEAYFQSDADRKMLEHSFDLSSEEMAQVNRELRESERQYRNIYENASEGIFQSTPEGKFISVNPAFAQLLGFATPEEMIKTVVDIKKQLYAHPEDRDKIAKKLIELGLVRNYELEFVRQNGQHIWVLANTKTVKDEKGKVLFFEGMVSNITERKKSEEEAKKRVAELEEIADAATGRELKMIELEKEVNQLLSELGREPKYK